MLSRGVTSADAAWPAWFQRGVGALLWSVVLVGVVLFFHDLDRNGSTWDEIFDYAIARHMARGGSVFTNLVDQTQTRLPHIVGAASLRWVSESTWGFKFPFVFVGLLGGALAYSFVRHRFGSMAALCALAYYVTNPWILASSRWAATAGDILVVTTTFGFFYAAVRLMEKEGARRRAHVGTFLLAASTGLAVGAKLTNLPLVVAGAFLVGMVQRTFVHVALFLAVSVAMSVAANPIFLMYDRTLADDFMVAISATTPVPVEAANPVDSEPMVDPREASAPATAASIVPIGLEATPKLRYVWTLLTAKLTLPFLLLVGCGLVLGVRDALARRKFDPVYWLAVAFVLAPCGVLLWKHKQNANYFLPVVVPAITLAVRPLAAALTSRRAAVRAVAVTGWIGVVLYQLWLSVGLAPDYLQAGRRLGPQTQAMMDGPAVNHCQGTPMLLERLNELRESEEFDKVYVFETCWVVVRHDIWYGSTAPEGYEVVEYDRAAPPERPFYFVVHDVIRYFRYGTRTHARKNRRLARRTVDCELVAQASPNRLFDIYRCL